MKGAAMMAPPEMMAAAMVAIAAMTFSLLSDLGSKVVLRKTLTVTSCWLNERLQGICEGSETDQ